MIANIKVYTEPYAAMADAHAIAILTEWDEFTSYDWQKIYDATKKSAFVFDGRNVLYVSKLSKIGFEIKGIGY